MLTSVPISSTVPENSIPKTNCLNTRLSIKPSTTETRKAWPTGHPIHFLELRGLKCPPHPSTIPQHTPPHSGKNTASKAQESELKISWSEPEKRQQSHSYQRTNENFKNGKKHQASHRYTSTSDPASLGPWGPYGTPITMFTICIDLFLKTRRPSRTWTIFIHTVLGSIWINWCCLFFPLPPPKFLNLMIIHLPLELPEE